MEPILIRGDGCNLELHDIIPEEFRDAVKWTCDSPETEQIDE